ncbi:hypothetical protein BGP_5477 [Beggiatoa sp. PS]|nr:hypothetical protein BGP_5477 [Beggiatoa sp. PS]
MNLAIKQQLISEIQQIANPVILVELFEVWQLLKKRTSLPSPILSYAGCLEDEDAEEMRQLIQSEFQHFGK